MRDVRVVERREDLRFALEAREAIGIGGERVGQDLERDVAIQLRVARAIHLAHAAGAEQRNHFIGTDTSAVGKGHENGVSEYSRVVCRDPPKSAGLQLVFVTAIHVKPMRAGRWAGQQNVPQLVHGVRGRTSSESA